MKLSELNQEYERKTLDAEADGQDPDDDDDDEFDESTEADLNNSLMLLEEAILLFDELVDDRLKSKNRISYKMGERIQKLTTEMWAFLQPFQAVNDKDKQDVVEGL